MITYTTPLTNYAICPAILQFILKRLKGRNNLSNNNTNFIYTLDSEVKLRSAVFKAVLQIQ